MANEKYMNTRVLLKNDIEANWVKANGFTPLLGELIIYNAEKAGDELPKDSEDQLLRDYYITYPRVKIGDGATNVNNLAFITDEIWTQVAQAQKIWVEDNDEGAVELKVSTLAPASEGVY